MAMRPEDGFLVIADLTGYTAYLARAELEHAPTIAGDLLDVIVGRLEPPFRLSDLEGDAAFLFAEDGRADGSLLLDALEAAYLAFRRRLRSLEAATTCDCGACSLAPRLDLKLFLHHGRYVRTVIAGRDEVAGPDVILVHRLTKGLTAEVAAHPAEGPRGVAVLTEAALERLGPRAQGLDLARYREPIEHLGTVDTFVLDLERRWQAEGEVRRIDIPADRATIAVETTLAAPMPDVWALVTAPGPRSLWEGTIEPVAGVGGEGSITRCVTGRLATIEEVVDWQPFEHVGRRVVVPGLGALEVAIDLAPDGSRTRLRLRGATADHGAIDPIARDRYEGELEAALARLGRLVESRAAADGAAPKAFEGAEATR